MYQHKKEVGKLVGLSGLIIMQNHIQNASITSTTSRCAYHCSQQQKQGQEREPKTQYSKGLSTWISNGASCSSSAATSARETAAIHKELSLLSITNPDLLELRTRAYTSQAVPSRRITKGYTRSVHISSANRRLTTVPAMGISHHFLLVFSLLTTALCRSVVSAEEVSSTTSVDVIKSAAHFISDGASNRQVKDVGCKLKVLTEISQEAPTAGINGSCIPLYAPELTTDPSQIVASVCLDYQYQQDVDDKAFLVVNLQAKEGLAFQDTHFWAGFDPTDLPLNRHDHSPDVSSPFFSSYPQVTGVLSFVYPVDMPMKSSRLQQDVTPLECTAVEAVTAGTASTSSGSKRHHKTSPSSSTKVQQKEFPIYLSLRTYIGLVLLPNEDEAHNSAVSSSRYSSRDHEAVVLDGEAHQSRLKGLSRERPFVLEASVRCICPSLPSDEKKEEEEATSNRIASKVYRRLSSNKTQEEFELRAAELEDAVEGQDKLDTRYVSAADDWELTQDGMDKPNRNERFLGTEYYESMSPAPTISPAPTAAPTMLYTRKVTPRTSHGHPLYDGGAMDTLPNPKVSQEMNSEYGPLAASVEQLDRKRTLLTKNTTMLMSASEQVETKAGEPSNYSMESLAAEDISLRGVESNLADEVVSTRSESGYPDLGGAFEPVSPAAADIIERGGHSNVTEELSTRGSELNATGEVESRGGENTEYFESMSPAPTISPAPSSSPVLYNEPMPAVHNSSEVQETDQSEMTSEGADTSATTSYSEEPFGSDSDMCLLPELGEEGDNVEKICYDLMTDEGGRMKAGDICIAVEDKTLVVTVAADTQWNLFMNELWVGFKGIQEVPLKDDGSLDYSSFPLFNGDYKGEDNAKWTIDLSPHCLDTAENVHQVTMVCHSLIEKLDEDGGPDPSQSKIAYGYEHEYPNEGGTPFGWFDFSFECECGVEIRGGRLRYLRGRLLRAPR